MRKIRINEKIDCTESDCWKCHYLIDYAGVGNCKLFGELELTENEIYMRHPDCLKAEVK